MAKDIAWTSIMVREFEYLVPMTEEQHIVFLDMVKSKTIVHTAMAHNMSTRKVDYIRQWLRMMYDQVQPYSPILPKRKTK